MSAALSERRLQVELTAFRQGNKTCFNCCSLSTYAVFPLCVAVCTNCSGCHRDAGHRVKGFGMSKFTADDVALLKAGGNAVRVKGGGREMFVNG